jgi:3-oxoacyl-[acyl-carrier-protein] synthase II
MDVVVTGIGLVCSLGYLSQSWKRLLQGESGIEMHQPFPEFSPLPLGLISKTPIKINYLLEEAIASALRDAQLTPSLLECGVVIGSSRGHQAEWEYLAAQSINGNLKAPFNWIETLPHQLAIAAARQIGSTGPVLAPMAACATGIWALAQGFELIQMGKCQRVIAGAVEAPITPLTLAGFTQIGAIAKTGCYPFDRQREGLVLAEGGAILVLESAELAKTRKKEIYGRLLGFGLTCDAYHVSTPESSRKSAIVAVKQCLTRSHLDLNQIDYIHAHGTSTELNDQTEAKLIKYLFPDGVPVSSTKGATGHTLGASGAIGAAFCLMSLKHQHLPPSVGLNEAEFDLDLITLPRRGDIRRVLCLSFGFGGQNAVMAVEKMPTI